MQRRRKKPKRVLEAVNHYYLQDNADVHRGVHTLAERRRQHMRRRVRKSKIHNASSTRVYSLYKGNGKDSTGVARYAEEVLKEGRDEVLISIMEHHSNIILGSKPAEDRRAWSMSI